jgi:hypothetical protein
MKEIILSKNTKQLNVASRQMEAKCIGCLPVEKSQ